MRGDVRVELAQSFHRFRKSRQDAAVWQSIAL